MMLQVSRLTKIFGGLRAVDDASLEVEQGSIVALIGPNGAGKTTMFACIAGFLPINGGGVQFLGRDITGWPVHRIARAGMVRTFQITQPFARLTVHENIAVGAYQAGKISEAQLKELEDYGCPGCGSCSGRIPIRPRTRRNAGTRPCNLIRSHDTDQRHSRRFCRLRGRS